MNQSNKLLEYLNFAARMYYAGEPVIPDHVYDALAETQKYSQVGAKPANSAREKHLYPMYSLQKYYEGEGQKPLTGFDLDCSPKLDGAAVSVLYIDGKLVRALTRGDGEIGQVVTDKFLLGKLVPLEIDLPGVYQITGEVCAPAAIENARNYAAGSLNLKDLSEFKTRSVEFFAYGVYPFVTPTFTGDMYRLKQLGFNTVKDPELHKIFPCDGVVFRVSSNSKYEELGFTSKHPKGAYALKERSESVVTELLDVVWQVGKSGKVTPVAILAPVKIGDAVVSRATLHNYAFIEALDLMIGDSVGVVRSGEIIPSITHKVE